MHTYLAVAAGNAFFFGIQGCISCLCLQLSRGGLVVFLPFYTSLAWANALSETPSNACVPNNSLRERAAGLSTAHVSRYAPQARKPLALGLVTYGAGRCRCGVGEQSVVLISEL